MMYPIECSDEFGLEGIKNAENLARWLNSWLHDQDSTHCVIEKIPNPSTGLNPLLYTLAPADAGDTQ